MLFRSFFAALLIFLFMSDSALAQKSEVNRAERLMTTGDLNEARALIMQAIDHQETANNARAWYVYGQIYQELMKAQGVTRDWFGESVKGYQNALRFSGESSNYHNLADMSLQGMYNDALNAGAMDYQQGEMEEAYTKFEMATLAMPQDTTGWLYAGVVAQGLENPANVLYNFRKLAALGHRSKDVYNSILYYELNLERDTTRALQTVRTARGLFPGDDDFHRQEINLLIKTGEIVNARAELEESIRRNPGDANLLFNLGFLYEELGMGGKAVELYTRSLEADENYFDAAYNLGVYYYNLAADLYAEANALSIEEYGKRGEALEDRAREYLKTAQPHFEKSSELRPYEPVIWSSLSTIYTRTGQDDKGKAAYDKYQELVEG